MVKKRCFLRRDVFGLEVGTVRRGREINGPIPLILLLLIGGSF
jgi:hypothetical protein